MEFARDVIDHLIGNKFHSGLKLKISTRESTILLRAEHIGNIVAKKNVLHLGCADHIALIKDKIDKNVWFHKQLLDKAGTCFGIDIDEEAVAYLNALGYENIVRLDITKDDLPESIRKTKWDYLILGEILEHVDNPVDFLSTTAAACSGIADRMILTVPNAFRIYNFKACMHHLECINTDHRYWFTPYTLAKIITRSHMTVEDFDFVQSHPLPRTAMVSRYLLRNFPPLRDVIVMTSRLA